MKSISFYIILAYLLLFPITLEKYTHKPQIKQKILKKPMTNEEKIALIALVTAREAGSEPYEGKLGVAYTIMNRAKKWKKSISQVIHQPWQYPCLTKACKAVRISQECRKAARAAFYRKEVDPTRGSTHFLQVETVLEGIGSLPRWYLEENVKAVIGNHTFLVVD